MIKLTPPSNPDFPWVAKDWQMLCYYCAEPIFLVKEGDFSALYNQRGNGGMVWRHANNEWACKEEHIREVRILNLPRCHVCGTQTDQHSGFCSFSGLPPYHATTMSAKEDEVQKWEERENNRILMRAIFEAREMMKGHDKTSLDVEEALEEIIAASPWGAIPEEERS